MSYPEEYKDKTQEHSENIKAHELALKELIYEYDALISAAQKKLAIEQAIAKINSEKSSYDKKDIAIRIKAATILRRLLP